MTTIHYEAVNDMMDYDLLMIGSLGKNINKPIIFITLFVHLATAI